tara:strand:+ start:131 stop:361 length:231 start_codon:yes stop_codon:yes gene_type:complete
MDNYKAIQEKLASRQNFRGSSMSGAWLDSTQYVVFSYASEIARIDLLTEFEGEVPCVRSSTTTSRHRNLVKKAWGL